MSRSLSGGCVLVRFLCSPFCVFPRSDGCGTGPAGQRLRDDHRPFLAPRHGRGRVGTDREAEAPAEATGGSAKSLSSQSPRIEDGYPNASASAPATETRIAFARFAEIERVNRMVNQRLIWRSDLEQYGVEEFWAFPIRAGLGYGDCEDFALEKRRGLLERGFPPAALALATAYSEETGLHAVLIVRTEQGDYVLDNTTPWVLPWQETPYRWLTIQAGESLTDWRLVDDPAAPTGDPDTRASV